MVQEEKRGGDSGPPARALNPPHSPPDPHGNFSVPPSEVEVGRSLPGTGVVDRGNNGTFSRRNGKRNCCGVLFNRELGRWDSVTMQPVAVSTTYRTLNM